VPDVTPPDVTAPDTDDADRRGESRIPVVVTVLVAMVLPFLMPKEFLPGPVVVLPFVEGALLIAMVVTDPGRIDRRSRSVRGVRMAMTAALALGAVGSTAGLVRDIVTQGPGTNSAQSLLVGGGLVWTYLVIACGFVFWEFDAGGPGERAHATGRHPDLLFPQQVSPQAAPEGWRPVFLDYLYVGLTSALAFSPTDAMPLSHWAKATMGVEALASLLILGLVVARAVNILA
jgi:hypothetical protein